MVQKRWQAAQRIRKSIWVGGLSPTRDPARVELTGAELHDASPLTHSEPMLS